MSDKPSAPTGSIECEEGTMIQYVQVPLTGECALDAVYKKVEHYDLVSIILDDRYKESTFRVEYRPKK